MGRVLFFDMALPLEIRILLDRYESEETIMENF